MNFLLAATFRLVLLLGGGKIETAPTTLRRNHENHYCTDNHLGLIVPMIVCKYKMEFPRLDLLGGPLDLLLYFIRKQNLDILDINVAEITNQYVEYIELMEKLQFDLAGEYLLMAAYLTEIKSRMMLPVETTEDELEDDPRAELIKRLQEYERFKTASMKIESMPRINRDFFPASTALPEFESKEALPSLELEKLSNIFYELLEKQKLRGSHIIEFEKLSTREKMSNVLELLVSENFLEFYNLYKKADGKLGLIVTFLAVLELVKDSMIQLVQSDSFGPIHVKAKEKVH